MVTVSTREQAQALRDELDVRIAADEYPSDLKVASTAAGKLIVSSAHQNWIRYIDEAGEVRG